VRQLDFFAAMAACVLVIAFALTLMYQDVPMNIATWGLWTILNGVNAIAMFRGGNKRPWLAGGYTLGALLVTLMVLRNGTWSWGTIETIALIGSLAALYISFKMNERLAIIVAISAMLIAAIPTVRDGWVEPVLASWWLWGGCAFSNLLSTIAAKGWTVKDRLYPVTGTAFNSMMFLLVLRAAF